MDPVTAAMLMYGGSKAIGGVADYIGGEAAGKARRRGIREARGDIMGGYGEARGYQDPIYDTGINAYQNLAGQFAGGEFSRPDFTYDPSQVFEDPEFQSAMRAGTAALGSSAEARGDLFSSDSQRRTQEFGQDLFSQRSDELFNRAATMENMGRQLDLTQFNMGMNLAQPGFGAASNLSNLATGEAGQLADLSTQMGNAKAGDMMRRANLFSDLGQSALGLGMGYMQGRNMPRGQSVKDPNFNLGYL